MSKFNPKGACLVVATIVILFGSIEVYGIWIVGDWSVLRSTLFFQLTAITLAVAPMMYGLLFASQEEE